MDENGIYSIHALSIREEIISQSDKVVRCLDNVGVKVPQLNIASKAEHMIKITMESLAFILRIVGKFLLSINL